MRRFKLNNERWFSIVKTLIAVLISLLIAFIVLVFTSEAPVHSFLTMLTAPLTKLRYFCNVLEMSVPLTFVALGCAILFRSGIFNLGGEGVFHICGIAATFFATKVTIDNGFFHPLLVILASGLCGGVIMLLPGYLKAKFDTNIVISSLMLNSILFGVGSWILKSYMLASDISVTASPLFLKTATLPYLFNGTRITIGFFCSIISVLVIHILVNRTRLGYKIRISGLNPDFAKYSGMNAFSLFLVIHFIAGLLIGIGSSVELMSLYQRFNWSKVTTHGVTGMLVSMIGGNKPIPAFVAALGISYLRVGAEIMSRGTNVPVEIVSVVEAALVLLISAQYFLRRLREKRILKEGLVNG